MNQYSVYMHYYEYIIIIIIIIIIMYYFLLNFLALLAHQGERNKKENTYKMVMHTSVLYRFLLVFGPPW